MDNTGLLLEELFAIHEETKEAIVNEVAGLLLTVQQHPAASQSFTQAAVNTNQDQLMCSCRLLGSEYKGQHRS